MFNIKLGFTFICYRHYRVNTVNHNIGNLYLSRIFPDRAYDNGLCLLEQIVKLEFLSQATVTYNCFLVRENCHDIQVKTVCIDILI